jgi:hypothetical protein
MIETAQVMSPWTVVNEDGQDINVALLRVEHDLLGYGNVTHGDTASIPPEPNNVIFNIKCETAVMDAIAADANYTILEGTRQVFSG